MKVRPAWKRIGFGLAGALLLAAFLYVGPSSTEGKSDWALGILATALSILAGILLAVITLLGDPRSLYPGSWRVASAHRRQIRNALNRFALLFWLYLGVIALVLATAVLEAYETDALDACWVVWMKHVALSVGSVALLWSFSLPATIRKAQLARLDREIEERKERAQSSPSDATTNSGAT